MSQPDRSGVVLPEAETGSSLFHRILCEASERWPQALSGAGLPQSQKEFRSGYCEALPRFEAARLAAPERLEIGRFLVERAQEALRLAGIGGERPLREALESAGEPLALAPLQLTGKGRLVPRVPYRGRTYAGRELLELASLLREEERVSEPVAAALRWLVAQALDEAGEIDLSGRRFAVLGAAAEIAPTSLLLEAGADVLWIDTVSPPETLPKDSSLSGRLLVPVGPTDLLGDPRAIAATLRACADEGALDLGLYAYAPGRGREWRLTGAMNAIVDSLPAGCVRSLALMVSPTTPIAQRPEALAAVARRHPARPAWQRALETLGLLGPGRVGEGRSCVTRNIVSVQGAGYQAAQYVGKTLAAERWATAGPTGCGAGVPVSANVAAITMTRSLRHPIFEAAFHGAVAFGVEAFDPDTTRALNGLLMIHDLLSPESPAAVAARPAPPEEAARDLLAQQVHGGLFSTPYAIEGAIRIAALLGVGRRPALLPGIARSLLG